MRTKSVVINLDRRPDRYDQFLSNFPFDHERFSGVDGVSLVDSGKLSPFQSALLSQLGTGRRNPQKQMKGIFGCWLSHYAVWNDLLYDFEHDAYVIFEDDINTSSRFDKEFPRILENIDESFDIYYFGGRFEVDFVPRNPSTWRLRRVNNLDVSYSVDRKTLNHDHDRGLFSYILTKPGAEKIVGYANESIQNSTVGIAAVDGWVNEMRGVLNMGDIFPHITWSPANFNSDIR